MDDLDELLDIESSLLQDDETGKRKLDDPTLRKDVTETKRARSGPTVGGIRVQPVLDFENEVEELLRETYVVETVLPTRADNASQKDLVPDSHTVTIATQQTANADLPVVTQNPASTNAAVHSDFLAKRVSSIRKDFVSAVSSDYVPLAKSAMRIYGKQIQVTSGSGERVYCAVHERVTSNVPRSSSLTRYCANPDQLLSRPINELMGELEQQFYERLDRDGSAARTKQSQHSQRSADKSNGGGLWVDKYSPKSFLELLSNEKVNREVLKWLKTWDACVFGTPSRGQGWPSKAKSGLVKEDNRPDHKVILICGPPGLGKTTLAHVVAAHCGYRSVEINASDERSGSSLSSRIESAVRMMSVVGDKRPNCVVVDEVDGAMGGAEGRSGIAALIKLVQAGGSGDTGDNISKGVAQKRSRKSQPLQRPIICICNDLYAPALRPLREIAKVFHIRKPTPDRVVNRLQWICEQEGVRVDRQALAWLAEESECDIRNCLNSLQWMAGKKKKLALEDVKGMDVGNKDMTKSAFDMWKKLFQQEGSRARHSRECDPQATSKLHGALVAFGEMELMRDGVHENLYNAKYFDADLKRTAAALHALGEADVMLKHVHKRMDFSLYQSVAACILRVRQQVAGHDRVELQWPRQKESKRAAANKQLLTCWMSSLPSSTYVTVDRCSALQELLPCLLWTLSPPLRPVAAALRTADEHSMMQRVVSIMLCYAVRYSMMEEGQEGEGEGGGVGPVPLKPAVDKLVALPGVPQRVRAVPLATRRLLEHEVELAGIQRRDKGSACEHRSTAKGAASAKPTTAGRKSGGVDAILGTSRDQILRRGKSGEGPVKSSVVRGNWLTNLQSSGTAKGAQNLIKGEGRPSFLVLYKFHEGYTNSVKRPLLMRDLM